MSTQPPIPVTLLGSYKALIAKHERLIHDHERLIGDYERCLDQLEQARQECPKPDPSLIDRLRSQIDPSVPVKEPVELTPEMNYMWNAAVEESIAIVQQHPTPDSDHVPDLRKMVPSEISENTYDNHCFTCHKTFTGRKGLVTCDECNEKATQQPDEMPDKDTLAFQRERADYWQKTSGYYEEMWASAQEKLDAIEAPEQKAAQPEVKMIKAPTATRVALWEFNDSRGDVYLQKDKHGVWSGPALDEIREQILASMPEREFSEADKLAEALSALSCEAEGHAIACQSGELLNACAKANKVWTAYHQRRRGS